MQEASLLASRVDLAGKNPLQILPIHALPLGMKLTGLVGVFSLSELWLIR